MRHDEEDGFEDGELTDTQEHVEEVANDLRHPIVSRSGYGDCPGVAGDSRGYGSASLTEVLNSLPNLTALAACASQGAAEILGFQSNSRQVMSPNSSPNLPQDPFRLHMPNPEADTNVRTETRHPKCKEDDASNASVPVQAQQEVKEEFESISGGLRALLLNQAKHLFVKVGGPMGLRDRTQDRWIKRQLILQSHGLI